MPSKSLNDLCPKARNKARAFLAYCTRQGIAVVVTCTYRSIAEQNALYLQGRDSLQEVNLARRLINLPPIPKEDNKIITRARGGESYHQYWVAFDVVPVENGKAIWSTTHPVWHILGAIAEACGLEWAGRWKRNQEFCHFQFTGGLTINDFRNGKTI
jgi:peptidoglycan L-alanyl-D-glutamate endopeptidase CwlK